MNDILCAVLGIAFLYLEFTLIMGFGFLVARLLANFFKYTSIAGNRKILKRIKETEYWTEEQGMTFAGFFSCPELRAVWYLADRSLFLMQIIIFWKRKLVLVTRFPDDVTLLTVNVMDDTGNSGPPGRYVQIFPHSTLAELWSRHCEAERYLVEECGVVFTPRLPNLDWPETDDVSSRRITNTPLREETIDRVKNNPFAVFYDGEEDNMQLDSDSFSRMEVHFVRKELRYYARATYRYMIGLFQWRWLLWWYWLFIRYWFIRNLTVKQLIEKGWYKHPQHLPPNYRKWYR